MSAGRAWRAPATDDLPIAGAPVRDGVELFRLYQRKTPDGDAYFVGTLGDAGITVVRDPVKRDVWRVIAVDPSRANNRNTDTTPARAQARPALEDWSCHTGDMDDDLPEDLLTLEREADDED